MNENELELIGLDWFKDIGWEVGHGPDISPDSDMRCEAIHKIRTIDYPIPLSRNRYLSLTLVKYQTIRSRW